MKLSCSSTIVLARSWHHCGTSRVLLHDIFTLAILKLSLALGRLLQRLISLQAGLWVLLPKLLLLRLLLNLILMAATAANRLADGKVGLLLVLASSVVMFVVNDDHRCLTFLLVTAIYHLVLFLILVPM